MPVILTNFTGQQMKKIEKKIVKLHFQNTDLERRIILKSKVISEIKEEINKQNICVLELEHLLAKLEVFENFRDEDLKKYFKNIKKTCKLVQKTVTR